MLHENQRCGGEGGAGDKIEIAAGTYKEDVIIGKSLSLIGHDADDTIIDATGLANGVSVDGVDNTGLNGVAVSGFTIENANFQGVLVANASSVTISRITGVDHSTVARNVVSGNSGGILVSDDTGATHDNVISRNSVHDTPFDCGLTFASHSGMGVFHNTIAGNDVNHKRV